MRKKPLIETNPYLKDAAMREKLVTRSVVTSCGVEGVKIDFRKMSHIEIKQKRNEKVQRDS